MTSPPKDKATERARGSESGEGAGARAAAPSASDARRAAAVPGEAAGPSSPPETSQDVVLIHGRTEDQKGLRVLRARPQGIEFGEVRPVEEGKPLGGDLVKLTPRQDQPHLCDVKTEFSVSRTSSATPPARQDPKTLPASEDVSQRLAGRGRPAQVASQTYRDGWDAIWTKPERSGNGKAN